MRRIKIMGPLLVAVLAALTVYAAPASASGRVKTLEFGSFNEPTGVAVEQATGNVFVANNEAKTVDISGPTGGAPANGGPTEITGVGFEGTEQAGIAAVGGDVYVTEPEAEAVTRYKYESGPKTYTKEPFYSISEPQGVAVDSTGHVYIASYGTTKIAVVNSTGTKVGDIEQSHVTHPSNIAVGAPGVVYVTGASGGTVYKLTVNGAYEATASEAIAGSKGGALAVDSSGNLYDDQQGSIVVFDSLGAETETIGSGELVESDGVAVNEASEDVYASSLSEGNLKVFGFPVEAPVNTGAPVVSGTAKEGKTLSTSNGTWENSPESYTYKWEDCEAGGGEPCTPIAGATAHEYTLTSNDVGKTVRSVVTAKNTGGEASADSVASAEVEVAGKTEASKTGEVYGEVPETTTLGSTCGSVYLGEFLPGKAENYHNTCALTVTSTGEESTLTAADESATNTGHLIQGSYFLAKALETKATDTEGLGGVSSGSLASLESPVTLLTYDVPVSADNVEVEFNQPIGLHDALHTGKYAKTITLTLKQTKP